MTEEEKAHLDQFLAQGGEEEEEGDVKEVRGVHQKRLSYPYKV